MVSFSSSVSWQGWVQQTSVSLPQCALESLGGGGVVKTQIAGLRPGISDSVSKVGPNICISSKLPDDSAVLRTPL